MKKFLMATSMIMVLSLPALALDGTTSEPHSNDASSTDIMGGGTPGHMSGGRERPIQSDKRKVQKEEFREKQDRKKHGMKKKGNSEY